jgi:hypothetical protein
MTAAYIEELLRANPSVQEVWLIGSRATGSATRRSDWDYIVIADQMTLQSLAADLRFNDPRVDLLVVYDGDNFRKPWPNGDREKYGSLSGWGWQRTSDGEAVYRATKPRDDDDFYSSITQGRAIRIYPRVPPI